MRLACSVVLFATFLAACSTLAEDPPAPYDANPLGTGLRIAALQPAMSPYYQQAVAAEELAAKTGGTNNGVNVSISSAVVSWIDTFDETQDGKSIGTVYIQDVGSTAPFAGIDLYEPSFVPASLRLLPGDVLDFSGPYEEVGNIGSAMFDPTQTPPLLTLPQLSKPVGTYRYDFVTPDPVVISLSDIDQANYETGRQWESMLVTIKDVTVGPGVKLSNRVTYVMGQGDAGVTGTAAVISNELYNLSSTQFPSGTHFSSVTGIVTWFYSYHVAPRSAADLQQ